MDLRDAVALAGQFTLADSPLSYLYFYPGTPGFVYGTDGVVGVLVRLDESVEVLPVALRADKLVKLARGADGLGMAWAGRAGELVRIDIYNKTGKALSEVLANSPQAGGQKSRPIVPETYVEVPDWPEVARTIHAVAHSEEDPLLEFLHLSPDGAEATDGLRMACVDLDEVPWGDVLVPRVVFKGWRKKQLVEVAFQPGWVFFRIGLDEVRWVATREPTGYPPLKSRVPELYDGPSFVVATKTFATVLKEASKHGMGNAVSLRFSPGVMQVRAFDPRHERAKQDPTEARIYEADVRGQGGDVPSFVLVNGKYLLEAVQSAATPNVLLGYGQSSDPIRVESGRYVAAVWPLMVHQLRGGHDRNSEAVL